MLPTGKLPPDLLADLLATLPTGPRVVLGPQVGEDAAVLDMGARYLVAKTDPITFATDQIGWYAVQINANDIAVTGATPLWFMASILLPANRATPAMARDIFAQIEQACRALDIAVIGGHTEITHTLDRPIVMGMMLGEVPKDRLVRTGGASPGDVVLLTKGAPIEATAIIAREKRDDLRAQFAADMLDRCAHFLHDPGISVVRDAQVVLEAGGVTSMHDPTEGGVLTGLWELADASQRRLEVDLSGDHAPWLPEADALCRVFDLNPAGAIASGALLLTAHPDHVAALAQACQHAGIPLFRLGHVRDGTTAVVDRQHNALPRPSSDEITKLFS
jgi:hydrogenase expression/formation protein HypE